MYKGRSEDKKEKKKEKRKRFVRSVCLRIGAGNHANFVMAQEENPILMGSFASLLNALERIPPVSSQIPERSSKLMAGSR